MTNNKEENDAITREAAGSCPKCRHQLPRLVECAPLYFKDGFVRGDHCRERVDLWQVALEQAARMSVVPGWALARLGAGQTSFVKEMESGKYYQVELSEHGVPSDAKILAEKLYWPEW